MESLPNHITDPIHIQPLQYNSVDQFFLKSIRDERDLPFIYFTLKILFFLIPFAMFLYTPILSVWQWAWQR